MSRLMGTLSAALFVGMIAAPALADDALPAVKSDRQAVLAVLTKLETGFNAADAKALASCWTETGEFVGPAGARADGRENIEKQFQEAFAARKLGKLQFHLLHFRLAGERLALVEATAETKPALASGGAPVVALVMVKQHGRWLIESARETIAHLLPDVSHLKELEWLVGDWASATSPAGVTLRMSCDWTANRTFLIRKFKVEGKEAFLHGGTEVIGWDPRGNHIHSWVFDSDGGFGESLWVHDGNRWLLQYSGTLADGSEAAATHILAHGDSGLTLQSKERFINGAAQPDIPETELKRQAETKPAEKAAEPAKPVEKSAPSAEQ